MCPEKWGNGLSIFPIKTYTKTTYINYIQRGFLLNTEYIGMASNGNKLWYWNCHFKLLYVLVIIHGNCAYIYRPTWFMFLEEYCDFDLNL